MRKVNEARSLVQLQVTPLPGVWHFTWDGGQHAANLTPEQLIQVLQRLKARDAQTWPRSTKGVTYADMVSGFQSREYPHCWVWSTDIDDLPNHVSAVAGKPLKEDSGRLFNPFDNADQLLSVDLEDGEYEGMIKGHVVTLSNGDTLDGFPLGLRNISPVPVLVIVRNSLAVWVHLESLSRVILPESKKQELDQAAVLVPPQNEDMTGVPLPPSGNLMVNSTREVFLRKEDAPPESEIEKIAREIGQPLDLVKKKLPLALKLSSEDFGKPVGEFGPKEQKYVIDMLKGFFEADLKKRLVKSFLESSLKPEEFIDEALTVDPFSSGTILSVNGKKPKE